MGELNDFILQIRSQRGDLEGNQKRAEDNVL